MPNKLTVSFVIFEEEVTESDLIGPVRSGGVLHDPLSVEPDAVRLGVDSQTLLRQQLLHSTRLNRLFFRPVVSREREREGGEGVGHVRCGGRG